MEKHVILRENFAGAAFTHVGGAVSRYEFFAAHDYNTRIEAVRLFNVKGKNKAARAEKFILEALADGLTVETFNSYRERVRVIGLSE